MLVLKCRYMHCSQESKNKRVNMEFETDTMMVSSDRLNYSKHVNISTETHLNR